MAASSPPATQPEPSKKRRARRSRSDDPPLPTIKPQKPRNEQRQGPPDRLSDLPDEILSCILLRLDDTPAAVRTSILSRRWVHLWRSVSQFRFRLDRIEVQEKSSATGSRTRSTRLSYELKERRKWQGVEALARSAHTFLTNVPKVERLSVDFCAGHTGRIEQLVGTALDKGVTDLRLCRTSGGPFRFPCSQFDGRRGSSLTQLELVTCVLNPPLNFDGFQSLSKLSLFKVWVCSNGVAGLLDKCKQLESLCLELCSVASSRKINSPHLRLKCLVISGCDFMEAIDLCIPNLEKLHYEGGVPPSLSFASLPRLKCLWLNITGSEDAAAGYMLDKLSADIPHVEDLVLWYRKPKIPITMKGPPTSFKSLRNLTLIANTVHTEDLVGMTLLLEAAPFLETLETNIHMFVHKRGSCYELQKPSDFQHYRLKKLTMNQFIGKRHEIAFARFVLEKALVLESLILSHKTIVHSIDWTINLYKSCQTWNKISRARVVKRLTEGISTPAQIIFS